MWPFSKKYRLIDCGLLEGGTDCHSHLLWGVDDGIRVEEDTLACLHLMEGAGLEHQWLTPHIMEDMPNKEEDLKARFQRVCEAYAAEAQPGKHQVTLHLGAEYMMDNLFSELLESTPLLTTYESETVLVETSTVFPPFNMDDILTRIKQKGYRPILAHPERYVYMKESDYKDLYFKGVLLQLNLPSLLGSYGGMEQAKAQWLLEHGMYYTFGTDTHRVKQLENTLNNKGLSEKVVDQLLNLKR